MILAKIRQELKENVDERYKEGSINFFKEKIRCYGVRSAITRNVAKKYFKEIRDLDKNKIFELCGNLLKTNYNEEASIAFSWCYKLRNRFGKSDFKLFERWINNYLTNWAMIDDFCTHSVGYLIHEYPELINNLKQWTKSNNRWVKRASAVSFIYPIRRKNYLKEVFEIADLLLLDKDDLVQKGYGWLLKVAADFYQKEVFNYVMKNKDKMPRTALRYAIEKMPKELKIKAMKR